MTKEEAIKCLKFFYDIYDDDVIKALDIAIECIEHCIDEEDSECYNCTDKHCDNCIYNKVR